MSAYELSKPAFQRMFKQFFIQKYSFLLLVIVG